MAWSNDALSDERPSVDAGGYVLCGDRWVVALAMDDRLTEIIRITHRFWERSHLSTDAQK